MITTERNIEHYENRAGGKGTMHVERLLPNEVLGDHVKMYAKITVNCNSSIGYHKHEGDSESYYILQGKANYLDEHKNSHILEPGAVTYTADGQSHGIENIGEEDLIFMAVIIK